MYEDSKKYGKDYWDEIESMDMEDIIISLVDGKVWQNL